MLYLCIPWKNLSYIYWDAKIKHFRFNLAKEETFFLFTTEDAEGKKGKEDMEKMRRIRRG